MKMTQVIKDIVTWLKQWFYDKTEVDSMAIRSGNIAGSTSAYTATVNGITYDTLTHGTLIALYNNNIGNNVADATLNVNNLGPKPIYYQSGAIPGSRFPNKTTGIFMYNTTLVSTGCWQMIYSYNSDTYTRLYRTTQVVPGENVSKYGIVWGKSDAEYYLIKSNEVFDIRHPILWATTALTSGTASYNLDSLYPEVSLRNTVSGKSVTPNKKIYVKGTLNGNQFTVASDVFVDDDHLDNGYYYVCIGTSYSGYQIRFNALDRTVYKYTTTNGLVPVGYGPIVNEDISSSANIDFSKISVDKEDIFGLGINDTTISFTRTSEEWQGLNNPTNISSALNSLCNATFSHTNGKATTSVWGHTKLGTTSDTAAAGNHNHNSTYLKITPTQIPNASLSAPKNLNDYTTNGLYYYSGGSATLQYIDNLPSQASNFILRVEGYSANYLKQTFTQINDGTTYIRVKNGTTGGPNSNGWRAWIKVTTTTV